MDSEENDRKHRVALGVTGGIAAYKLLKSFAAFNAPVARSAWL